MRVIGSHTPNLWGTLLIIILGLFLSNLLPSNSTILAKGEHSIILTLEAVDYGEVRHVEYVPRPPYEAKALVCSEIARELLLKSLYGIELDEVGLSFILACRRNGYFSQTPSEVSFNPEATLYATWLLKVIGARFEVNASLLLHELIKANTFDKAYYIVMTLRLLGYNVSENMLRDFDLGYAISWIRNSSRPSIKATAMWLCLFKDAGKARWLLENARDTYAKVRAKLVLRNYSYEDFTSLSFSEWFNIETLIAFRPAFINATIVPAIVVKQEPRIVSISIIKWSNEVVKDYEFSWSLENGKIISRLGVDKRLLTFEHYVAREETAWLRLERTAFGLINVTCVYKPPYTLKFSIGGLEFKLEGNNYEEQWTLEVPLAGEYKVKAMIKSPRGILIGEGTIRLEASFERTLLDYAWLGLPLLSTIVALCGAPSRRHRLKLGLPAVIVQVVPAYCAYELLRLHPIWLTLASGAILLALARLVNKEALEACLGHITVITVLCMASMLTSNPMVLLLGGIGSGLFLASAILYPSERERTERLYKSTMLIYALGILIMSLVNQLAINIANFLYAPDEAFIDSIRIQAMFIANLIAITPIIAPLAHLARLIHAFERAKEAEAIVKSLEH
ncbi:MAG: hypothetical protein DRJ60_02255 [Thermoprotei archaeon]|nr:MAG: hypothetical protein DRJ60_02255 [Thermoprotei archaeon]